MFVLSNAVRDYAWGSTDALASFLGRPPDGGPQAELWIGAHPGDPSRLPDGTRLDDAIRAEPQAMLGERVAAAFGDRLPYLMKVLSVNEPLSLQVHPESERALEGYARQEELGIPLDAPERSYPDPWHKPELLFAISRFEGLAGFRDVERTTDILRLLDVAWADDLAGRLSCEPVAAGLREIVTETLALSGEELDVLLRSVGRAARLAESRGRREAVSRRAPGSDHDAVELEAVRAFGMLGRLARRYPRDPGVLVSLLLNHVVLAPGEAIFVDSGVVHAYTAGFGLEIMASSDNVLRAGLTPKHVDVDDLLAVTDFAPLAPPRPAPAERSDGAVELAPPVAEFALVVGRPPLAGLPDTGPRVLLVLDGEVEVGAGGESQLLGRGTAVFVPHADGPIDVRGPGRAAVGSVPPPVPA